jgi:Mor family transcriptional regulator
MQPSDIDVYKAWMSGESIGSIAKRQKTDKQHIRRIINRAMDRSRPEVLLELQTEEAGERRDV